MTETLKKPVVISLDAMPKDGKVWVNDDNEKRILMTVDQVMNACKMYNRQVRYQDVAPQVHSLWERFDEWLIAQKDSVRSACLAFADSGRIQFLVFQKGVEFNEQLSDALTDLDLDVSNHEAFSLIKMSVRLMPDIPADQVEAIISQG